jgi:SOS-response transcriptional repressor LexA
MLTPAQKNVVETISYLLEDKTYAPTIREIAEHANKSVATIYSTIVRLKGKGVLDFVAGQARKTPLPK